MTCVQSSLAYGLGMRLMLTVCGSELGMWNSGVLKMLLYCWWWGNQVELIISLVCPFGLIHLLRVANTHG